MFAVLGPIVLMGLLAPGARAQAVVSPSKAKRHTKKPAAHARRKTFHKPAPIPADIPEVAQRASVWRGCLESQDLPKLASSLGMEESRLGGLLEELGTPLSEGGGCLAYVAATGGEAGVASVIFRQTDPAGDARTLAFHKTADGIITTPAVCDCRESTHRVLDLPAQEFSASIDAVAPSIPANVRWELGILVPRMIEGVPAKKTDATDGGPADASGVSDAPDQLPVGGYTVRVGFGRYGEDDRERLESIEILEQPSGRRVNGAWWLDRADGPGVIIGMDGVAYERLLWESPVKYVRVSRGVGAKVTTSRRRVPAKKGSGKSTIVRTTHVSGYHLGVDMMAPKGTDVHAVGDATVGFAGRKRGFGNVIILDHGRGYQTYYAHLSKIGKGIKAGVQVARGDIIGLVGSTGHSTAPHLHFETRKDAHYLDPFDETRELEFWLLTPDEQEKLAMQILAASPAATEQATGQR